MDKKQFGSYLRELRKNKKMTIRQLALYSGVSNAYISQVERGDRNIPSPEILQKISKPLGVDYGDLMEKAGYLDHYKAVIPQELNSFLKDDFTTLVNTFLKNLFEKVQEENPELFEELGVEGYINSLSLNEKIETFLRYTNSAGDFNIAKSPDNVSTIVYQPNNRTKIELLDSDIIDNIDFYYDGMKLNNEEKKEFFAIARAIFSARRDLKEK